MFSEEGKAYRSQLIAARVDEKNRFYTFVPELRQLFKDMGCTVTEEHINELEEKRPDGVGAAQAAVRQEKKIRNKDAIGDEALDDTEALELLRRHQAREKLNREEGKKLQRARLEKLFGPEMGEDNVRRYNLSDEKARAALMKPDNQERFGMWCQLAEAEHSGGQRTLAGVLAAAVAAIGTESMEAALASILGVSPQQRGREGVSLPRVRERGAQGAI